MNDREPSYPFELEHDASGRLSLIGADGVVESPVEPVRCFPLSEPDCWIAICDANGRELFSIEDIARLSRASRQVLELDLARREFVPLIRRILRRPADTEPSEWDVETDRGPTKFLVNSDADIRRLGPHRALVIDSNSVRYLIHDTRQLDPGSRRILERYF